ncbi:MAG: methyltransferase family protein [Candidatus Dormibacteria bacterium]
MGSPSSPLSPGVDAVAFWVLIAAWVGFEVSLQWRARSQADSPANQADHNTMPALIVGTWAAVAGGVAAAQWIAIGRIPDPYSALVAGGGVLMALGMALRWWAVRVLGRHFTVRVTTSADQRLVQTGPYRWLRHPGYAGALLTVAGCLCCCADIISITLLALPAAAYAMRVAVEERAMGDRFGAEYVAYAAKRSRLIPFLL